MLHQGLGRNKMLDEPLHARFFSVVFSYCECKFRRSAEEMALCHLGILRVKPEFLHPGRVVHRRIAQYIALQRCGVGQYEKAEALRMGGREKGEIVMQEAE
jgi:hypothetical protein